MNPSGGNYWSWNPGGVDFRRGQYQNETGSDGIGDTPHVIDGNNSDCYPLMVMFYSYAVPYFALDQRVTVVSNSTVSDFAVLSCIEHPEVRRVQFNGAGEDGTVGFCRVCVPTALMDGNYTVLVNGSIDQHHLLPCSNRTHNYLYFNYTLSTKEVVIVPELPSFFTLPPFTLVTLLATSAHRRKRSLDALRVHIEFLQ